MFPNSEKYYEEAISLPIYPSLSKSHQLNIKIINNFFKENNMKNNKINFIAEISSNHNKNLKRTLNMIDSAKKSGFNSVKFQLFKIENYLPKKFWITSQEHKKRSKMGIITEFIGGTMYHTAKREVYLGKTT